MNSPSRASAPSDRLEGTPASHVRADVRAGNAYPVGDASGMIKLDAMENPYRLPDALMQQLGVRLAALAVNRYPASRAPMLRQAIAVRNALSDGQDVMLGNGSDELISIMITACATPSACVLSLGPGFVMYRIAANLARVPFVEVPLSHDFQIDRAATLDAIGKHRPNLIFIAYPNNPTGTLFLRDDIEAIIEQSDALVVIDEAYESFSSDSFVDRLAQLPQLLIMRTLSKLGLAGIRLGYLMGDKALIAEFDKVRPPYNVSVLTQCAAEFALAHVDVLIEQARQLKDERQRLSEALSVRAAIEVIPSEANFLLFRIKAIDPLAATRVFEGLRRQGVLIKNVSSAHALLNNCLRVTVSTPKENEMFLAALDTVMSSQHGLAA